MIELVKLYPVGTLVALWLISKTIIRVVHLIVCRPRLLP